jgi:hypothetical protein
MTSLTPPTQITIMTDQPATPPTNTQTREVSSRG